MIKNMHYHFRQGLNKVDSNGNRNFKVPEIDYKLRQAELKFIKDRIIIGDSNTIGILESDNKIREELKNIVSITTITNKTVDNKYTVFNLPTDYMYAVSCTANVTSNSSIKNILCLIYNNYTEITPFNESSFEWGEIHTILSDGKIKLRVGNFTVNSIELTYIKKPRTMHNAEDSGFSVSVKGSDILSYYNTYDRLPKGLTTEIGLINSNSYYTIKGYIDLDGTVLFGYVNTELSEICEIDIVESAIIDTIGDITTDVNLKAQLKN